jgi:uncharacterized FlaG/YvyC family protein
LNLRTRSQFEIDEGSKRVYLKVTDPVTGNIEKYPSESQLKLAAAIRQEFEKKLARATEAEVELPPPGELLNTKA